VLVARGIQGVLLSWDFGSPMGPGNAPLAGIAVKAGFPPVIVARYEYARGDPSVVNLLEPL
jgi:hypothetical protein